jgi:hypothetical protein
MTCSFVAVLYVRDEGWAAHSAEGWTAGDDLEGRVDDLEPDAW